jgi:hypothetical protein
MDKHLFERLCELLNEDAQRVLDRALDKARKQNYYCPVITPEDIVMEVIPHASIEMMAWYSIDCISFVYAVEDIHTENPQDFTWKDFIQEVVSYADENNLKGITPWHVLWLVYPYLNPKAAAILGDNSITRESIWKNLGLENLGKECS